MHVVVIGGGAAGMVAAIAAAGAGARVTVLEANDRVGRKLLTTGNGRCNLAQEAVLPANYHGAAADFVQAALARRGVAQTLDLFRSLGVWPVVEDQGRIFPRSGQASAVLDALRWELEDRGIAIRCGAEVVALRPADPGFLLSLGTGDRIAADRVVLATGGRAAPATGAKGGGYALARALGHRVLEPFPALVPLKLAGRHLKATAGVRVDARATVRVGGQVRAASRGEVLFAEYGASGPAVMDVSRAASEALARREPATLSLELVDDLDAAALGAELAARFAAHPARPASACLVGFLHKRLAGPVLKDAGVDPDAPALRVDPGAVRRIAGVLKDWSFDVTGTGGWAAAQVTAGGIDTAEVDPSTMQSRRVPGLFLAGEVLDVDGDCGGFNLQWAWSSGWIAGECAATSQEPVGK